MMISLENFGFYRIYRHSKEVLESVLKEFFSNLNKQTEFLMPTIKFFEWNEDSSSSKINIYKDWFSRIRKLPFIVVSLTNFTERQLEFEQTNSQFLGVEDYMVGQTSTGLARFGVAVEATAKFTLGTEDSDSRMDLIDLLFCYFSLYGKSVRQFRSADGLHDFYFSVPKQPIKMTGETEVNVGTGAVTRIYAAQIDVPIYIEAYYRLQVRDVIKTINYQAIIKED